VLRTLSLCTCCRHYPGAAAGRTLRSSHPAVSAFPERVVGSACTSSFSRLARRSLALRPAHSRGHQFVARYTEGFSHFVSSMTAPVASGWSDCRVGLSPTGKRRLSTAHTQSGPSRGHQQIGQLSGRMRENDLLAPGRVSSPLGPRNHGGTIIPETINAMRGDLSCSVQATGNWFREKIKPRMVGTRPTMARTSARSIPARVKRHVISPRAVLAHHRCVCLNLPTLLAVSRFAPEGGHVSLKLTDALVA
jgi:hypothetical protein